MGQEHAEIRVVDSALSALLALDGPGTEMHSVFAGALRWSGVPEVHAPPYFWAPRSCDGDRSLLEAAQSDAASWANARLLWRQRWYVPDLILGDDPQGFRERIVRWERRQTRRPPIRPNRRLCLPLFAAYAHDIAGLSPTWAVGHVIGMNGTVDRQRERRRIERRARTGCPQDRTRAPTLPRFKGVPHIIANGRQLAHDVGGWPLDAVQE